MKTFFLIMLLSVSTMSFSTEEQTLQLISTSLTVTVIDELGNSVSGATVKLFETEDNYNKDVNAVAKGETDSKGSIKFKKLKPIAYFLLAKKGDKDNAGGGEKVGTLEDSKINKTRVVIQ